MMYALKTEIPIDSHCKAIPTPSVKFQVSDWMHCVYGDVWEWVWGRFGASSEASPYTCIGDAAAA